MKKYLVLLFTTIVIFFACNTKNKNAVPADKDAGNGTNAGSNSGDTFKNTIDVTPFELRDDSVFTDGSIPTKWENAGFTDVKGFKMFLKQMQLWVMDNNKEKLASAIKYPINNIKTPEELIANYDKVFTKEVKLSFATINFNQIFRNQQGAMTAGGKVWFAQQGKAFKIIAVNN